jgi:alpha-galactosidase
MTKKMTRGMQTVRSWVNYYTAKKPVATWTCIRQGWGQLQIGLSCPGKPIRLAGREFAAGFGTHADSDIRVCVTGPARRFQALVGWDDNEDVVSDRPESRVRFSVSAAGRELWRSPDMAYNDKPVKAVVELPEGITELTLKAESTDGNIRRTHVDWVDPVITLAGGQKIVLAEKDGTMFAQNPAPFSFNLGGRPSAELLKHWKTTSTKKRRPGGRTVHNVTWKQPGQGLECRMEMETFKDFPVIEWVLHLKNSGTGDTPVLDNIQALDWRVGLNAKTPVLHRSLGSLCKTNDFEYLSTPLERGQDVRMIAGGGRSSQDWLPFFNLEVEQRGVIMAIGWTGQWAADFSRGIEGDTRVRAGMEETHLVLHPGEEIRSPRILLLFWDGDRMASHNLLRRFILAHHTPEPAGKPLQGPLTIAHWGGMKSKDHLVRIEAYRHQKLDYDYYWIDAGWYGPASSFSPDEHKGDWFKHVGDWSVNPAAHPDGLRPLSDAAKKIGMKFLLWFEPERAIYGTPWTMEHPEWFLGERKPGKNLLFNLGNPEARKWLTDFILDFMDRNRIDLYRQDFNFEPLKYWRANDAPDRKGMSEIRYIEGLYEYWDALLKGHPGLVIDNCASGGRRIDLETTGRSIPLWRSDWQCRPDNNPIGGQVHGMGLSHWLPLHGTGVYSAMPQNAGDTYRAYSTFGSAIQFTAFPYEYSKMSPEYPWAWHRRMLGEMRRAQPLFLGDYYPIAGQTPDAMQWALYQMNRPDLGEGFVMALRRPDSAFTAATVRLKGLNPAFRYTVEVAGSGRRGKKTGKELMENGIAIELPQSPSGCLVFYKRVSSAK